MQQSAILKALVLGAAAFAGAAHAQNQVLVTQDITTSTVWTANNTYNLQNQIYVMPGATLTIQAGTVVASTTGVGGSLAVTQGAQIYVQGTEKNPVIMTSTSDVATWVNGNPKTGTWREACNEWGNLTMMGRGYVSANNHGGATTNVPTPNANNVAPMEGLTAAFPGDPRVLYGGGDDDDDSGTITYLSIRYGGRVIGLGNELNGLSMGGIGRGTDINHVEIMNNVDDGIETWGGAVNYKYLSIWNIGDDNFDFDEGWRGKAQFLLLVQGYSVNASQGSGVGDNVFEMDGAEDSDWQPVTTSVIYNATAIGQPIDGDHMTAWRDNARVQFHNCIFMDCGEYVVGFDNTDGDGAHGYGYNGTLSWPATWTTPYTAVSTVNTPPNPSYFYRSQTSGNLIEMTDSVFYNNTGGGCCPGQAYTEANARGVFAPANNNVLEPANSPITSIARGPMVIRGGLAMVPVTSLNPMPANDALTSVGWAPHDGFFSSAHYRGAFAPGNNWISGWTASDAFGFTQPTTFVDLGYSLTGVHGDPVLGGTGTLAAGTNMGLSLSNAKENALSFLGISFGRLNLPLFGGVLVPDYNQGGIAVLVTSPTGTSSVNLTIPPGFPPGALIYLQQWVVDPAGPSGLSASNAIVGTFP
jgi:hypothetical protein